jgi:prefoldin subunit 5
VEFAAIQGLNRKLTDQLNQKDAEIQNLQKQLDELEASVTQLAARK